MPRVAMELMRHSDLRLTMKVYTDATCLPTTAAIDSLPGLNKPCSHRRSQKMFPVCPSKSQVVTVDNQAPSSERVGNKGDCRCLSQIVAKRKLAASLGLEPRFCSIPDWSK
jgi:hypothetical protein